jgi:hypothetical protein
VPNILRACFLRRLAAGEEDGGEMVVSGADTLHNDEAKRFIVAQLACNSGEGDRVIN